MRKYVSIFLIFSIICSLTACNALKSPVKETADGYEIASLTELTVVLKTPLNSSTNQRGDQFVAVLKSPFLKNKIILPKGTEIRGLVKRVNKYEKMGGRAGLLLIFDQIVLKEDRKIPLVASLDTDQGASVVKVPGKVTTDATVIGGTALAGVLLGKGSSDKESGMQRGLMLGAGLGAGAVILSNMKEVKLPEGTELIIKLDEPLFIPKR